MPLTQYFSRAGHCWKHALFVLIALVLIPHFTNEETEAQRR